MDTQRAMADLPELQRRLLERSRLLGFEPYADAPMRVRDRPSSEQDSGSGDDGEEACAVEAPVSRPRGKTCASGSPTMTLLNPIGSKIRAGVPADSACRCPPLLRASVAARSRQRFEGSRLGALQSTRIFTRCALTR
ncbi:uncharacterized protein LOC125759529 [Rhipicephalus sanguineus]|uniref:uncharacterized protein LOC125759529 n=1 Tax=Rhipicephalus sanguineus TaxID=34632 RepID=UPI0020C4BEFE|nr:uncharacterized protein LOC125759529 [Rhipicephalus sanguineus]